MGLSAQIQHRVVILSARRREADGLGQKKLVLGEALFEVLCEKILSLWCLLQKSKVMLINECVSQ